MTSQNHNQTETCITCSRLADHNPAYRPHKPLTESQKLANRQWVAEQRAKRAAC